MSSARTAKPQMSDRAIARTSRANKSDYLELPGQGTLVVFIALAVGASIISGMQISKCAEIYPEDEYSRTKSALLWIYTLGATTWPVVLWCMLQLTGAGIRSSRSGLLMIAALFLPIGIFAVDIWTVGAIDRPFDFEDSAKRSADTRNTAGVLVSATFALGTLLAILRDRRSLSSAYLGITSLLLAIGIVLPNFETGGSDYDQMVIVGIQKTVLMISISLFVTGIIVELS